MTNLLTIAQLECRSVARLKWIRLLTAAFALLAAAAAYSAGAASDLSGADSFPRTTLALVPVALILIPLAAAILGVSGQAIEAGSESFLFSQPVSRITVLVGRWLGQLAGLGAAIVLGFGIGGAIVATGSGRVGVLSFAFFVAMAVALAAVFLSLAATIAVAAEKRQTALGLATFVWFFFVLLYDGMALSLAGWLTVPWGGRALFASVFGNPADLIRVAILFVAGTPSVLSAAGEAWTRFLGGDVNAIVAAAVALAAWTLAPLATGAAILRARDL
jgi:Cu-processing system permease protein